MARSFRTPESYESERVTRRILPDFLTRCGFSVVNDTPNRNGQTIVATTPEGDRLTMRVHLCWRRQSGSTYSAAQLLAKIKYGDWEGTLQEKVERESSLSVTHFLFVQSEGTKIVYAALVPLSAVLPIWIAQRDTSDRLIKQGQLGRRTKNHAMNGSSPTLWLQDDRAPQVAEALWNYPGVRKLIKLQHATSLRLRDEEGDQVNANDDAGYSPQEGDRRQVVERQIRARRGQQQFRDALCTRYGNRCLVTGSEVLAVLEAAHIKPYRGEDDNHPENGLLLRADIHTLFDLDLLGIEPEQLRVELHPDLANNKDYGSLAGKTLYCARDQRPSQEALQLRYAQFQQRVYRPA
jgi:5-methylcytosine-specific restriction protein A